MNLLIDAVPKHITIDKIDYDIDTNFRIWIMFEQLLLDNSIDDGVKGQMAFNMIFFDKKPAQTDKAVNEIINFYCCGKDTKKENHSEKSVSNIERIYDYDVDDEYIYSAFLQQYGINLQTVKYLHWWEFKALFKGLKEDCKIVEIMGYRSIDINAVQKSQRSFYRKMKKIYALPLSNDEIEKNNLIEQALLEGKSINNLL